MMIIHLISSPRNVSTALMYSFAQRRDTIVMDEPFYAYYLKNCQIEHPGMDHIIEKCESDPDKIIQNILKYKNSKKILFIKNMAHHIADLDIDFMVDMKNIFFIRNPLQLITSFAKVIANPGLADIGIKTIYQIYSQSKDGSSVVLDSGELLKDPHGVLGKLCNDCKIPFDESMISWPAGPKPYDGIWAEYWYENVHKSTSFAKQRATDRTLSDKYLSLYESALPFYNELFKHSIKA